MRIINEIRLAPDEDDTAIEKQIIRALGGAKKAARSILWPPQWVILRKSVDARRHNQIRFQLRVGVLEKNEKMPKIKGVSGLAEVRAAARLSIGQVREDGRGTVVIGSGPAGLFAALVLAEARLQPILIEQGEETADRVQSVERYWRDGASAMNPFSNVQFGEGGAGTFSDGKLATGTRSMLHRSILETFVQAGAAEPILYEAKPHLGTDVLQEIVPAIRRRIIELGGTVRFNTEVIGLDIHEEAVVGVEAHSTSGNEMEIIPAKKVILATGHSSGNLVKRLFEQGVLIEQKDFAVGVRIEHHQSLINSVSYGEFAVKAYPSLPTASYKLAVHPSPARSCYTFCMCPGGVVVAAASGENQVVTNGMSYAARDGEYANSALLVNVKGRDLTAYEHYDGDPMAGYRFQKELERRAFEAGGCSGKAPAQTVGNFIKRRVGKSDELSGATYRPGVESVDLHEILPAFITSTLSEALPLFERRFKGFSDPTAIMTAVESRSSSPVCIVRDHCTRQSNISGLYPVGEGAGYAGGIMSAATDGIKSAFAVMGV